MSEQAVLVEPTDLRLKGLSLEAIDAKTASGA